MLSQRIPNTDRQDSQSAIQSSLFAFAGENTRKPKQERVIGHKPNNGEKYFNLMILD
jgi:hypothetical protein